MQVLSNIVAVKGYIQFAVLYFICRYQLIKLLYHLVRYKNAAWLYSYKNSICKFNMILKYLVTEPFYCYLQLLFVQYRFQENIFIKISETVKLGN